MIFGTKNEWLGNVRGDVLSGLVVALALIPEAIAFSIIAGVDPKVGLYASFCIAVISSFLGGRPGMISAATGAMALVMVTLVKSHGLEYLLAASILTGIIQIFAGYLHLGSLMRFVSRSVVTGFVNALAILIFMAQLPELTNVSWHVYALVALGLLIIYGFPYLNQTIPSPLVTIVVVTAITVTFNLDVRTVGDMGALPDTLPVFLWPNVPLNLDTLWIVLPYSISLATVGLLESLMTATIVDDMTHTHSNKDRECKGQGWSNIGAGLLGGMAGCAMIGQSVINVKSGGRGRLSTFLAGVLLLVMVVFLSDWIKIIPMAALVAVMIMVSIGTFSWDSLKKSREYHFSTSIVLWCTVAVVVFTHNLAYGVLVGVLLSAVFFAHKISRFLLVQTSIDVDQRCQTFVVRGQVFFASAEAFIRAFDTPAKSSSSAMSQTVNEDSEAQTVESVTIDLSHAHFWDITSVEALDKVVMRFRRLGIEVSVVGTNSASCTLIDQFGVFDKPDLLDK